MMVEGASLFRLRATEVTAATAQSRPSATEVRESGLRAVVAAVSTARTTHPLIWGAAGIPACHRSYTAGTDARFLTCASEGRLAEGYPARHVLCLAILFKTVTSLSAT